jgi:ribosome biogenesis GTPase A
MEREASDISVDPRNARSIIDKTASSLLSIVERQRLDSDGVLLESVNRLKARAASNQISLAVLGEFSSGKTTFINSLLNTDILATGILPTTAVCTYISYGPEPVCEVSLKDGTILQLTSNEVAAFSSEGSRSADVEGVRLKLSAPLLADGLIVVDTPGVNVNIDEHEAITASAIESANACVYLMDARQPGKKTTIDFLSRILRTIDKFFFVLNRADILDPAEQDEALEFVTTALTNECGISEPKVVLLSSSPSADGTWQKRFRAFEQSLREFMLNERDSVICAELARLLDDAIARSEQLLESKYRVAEQELSAHYNLSLPDATEIVSVLREQINLSIEDDTAQVKEDFLALHESVCENLRGTVEKCISSNFTVEGLVNSAPAQISKAFDTHLNHLNNSLAESFRTIFSNRQSQVAATVSQLFSGVRWLEQKAFFSRLGFWISILIGVVSLLGLELICGAPRANLIISPFLGATTAALVYGTYYWARNRFLFSPATLPTLKHAGYVQSAITGGAMFQNAAANPVKPNSAPIHIGRGVWNLTGNPLFMAAGAAISGVTYGIGLLMDKVSGILGKLRTEIRDTVRPLLDDFEKGTKDSGLGAIAAGREGVRSALHTVLDKSMERYQVILNRLLKPHRRIRESLELRRNTIREDAEVLRAARQVTLDSLYLLEERLKGTGSRYAKSRTEAVESNSRILQPINQTKLRINISEMTTSGRQNQLLLAWLGCLAASILLTFTSIRLAGDMNLWLLPDVGSRPTASEASTLTPSQPHTDIQKSDDYSVIRNALSSDGYLADGPIMDVPGVTPASTLHVQKVTCTGTAEPCRKFFVFLGSESVWSEDLGTC